MAFGRRRGDRDRRVSRLADRSQERAAGEQTPFDTPVARLCRYYLDCLGHENAERARQLSESPDRDLKDGPQADETPAPRYTKGLEFELRALQTIPLRTYRTTALGEWVNSRTADSRPAELLPPLEVVALDSEQRQAVEQGLANPLTVITGPPGTGKSQVVAAIVVNAARQGKTVLFASKNNKAVDLVESRVNALGPRPVLLRLGADVGRLAGQVASVLGATAAPEDHELHRDHEATQVQLRYRAATLEDELDALVSLRNRVDRLEQQVEEVRQQIGDLVFRRLGTVNAQELSRIASQFQAAFDRAAGPGRRLWTRLMWPFVRKGRVERLAEAREGLETLLSEIDWKPRRDLPGCVSQLTAAARYFAELTALTEARSLEDVGAESARLADTLVANAGVLWRTWLRLQPSRVRQEQRKLLSDYSRVLQLIVSRDWTGLPARDVFRRHHQLFEQITPVLSCWAVTSLSVRGRVPFVPALFDVLVIDEASQCDIASALPLLYRARHVVVIGDPMQLQHISNVSPRQDYELLRKHELMDDYSAWAYSARSLFDLATSACRPEDVVELREHHRSHADIIAFSNGLFYGGRLRVATNHDRLRTPGRHEPAVRWVDVQGPTVRPAGGGAVNEAEAQAAVKEIERLVAQAYRGSIGVVCPFRAQAGRIRALVHEPGGLVARNPGLDVLSDTVHKFQGDERDVMIFSPAVSYGISEGAIAFLRRNPNLFNVAITRARAALIVVGNRAAALDGSVDYLARFAAYADQVGSRARRAAAMTTGDQAPEYPAVLHPERVSDWDRVFYQALYRAGLRPVPQYLVGPYAVDLALLAGTRRLAIDVDDAMYHRPWDREVCRREQIRSQRLRALGWDLMRFWVYQVRDDLGRSVSRVTEWAGAPRRP